MFKVVLVMFKGAFSFVFKLHFVYVAVKSITK